jgi:branched-chain amino acid transport system permease protein
MGRAPAYRSERGRVHKMIEIAPHLVIALLLLFVVPLQPTYIQSLVTKILIFAIFAMSLDLLIGYTGIMSLGHAAFFGTAGYAAGILVVRYGVDSVWLGLGFGILLATLVAAVFGIIALQARGIYSILITFALGQLLYSVATKWRSVTNGDYGLWGIPIPSLGLSSFEWNGTYYYYFVFLAFIVCYFCLYRLVKSPFGKSLQGIREGESRMRALGYNIWLFKYVAFIIAGMFAGAAGVLYAYHSGIMTPGDLAVANSGFVMLMAIAGGVGTIYGPVIGAALIITIQYYAGILTPNRWPLILGGVFVLTIMYARAGVGVYFFKLWKRVLEGWKF